MAVRLPSRKEALQALGDTRHLPRTLRRALDPGPDFKLLPEPHPGDWLAEHREPGQSFREYVRLDPPSPDSRRTSIALQPLGEFPAGMSPSLESLRDFSAFFFRLQTDVLHPLSLSESGLTARRHPITRNRQILTRDVLDRLRHGRPSQAFCVLAVTMEDLYPDPAWNFVFGQASLRDRVGVFSFARYDPAFFGQSQGESDERILLRRSCKVLAHEACHLFWLAHCIHFRCLMNGSNHLAESDARPLALCPVCLRKLCHSIGFDVLKRYQALQDFYRKSGLRQEADWTARRLRHIQEEE